MRLSRIFAGAFLEYALLRRLLAVNADSARLLKDFKENAQTRYQTGGTEQDVLQADVELGRQRERLLELEQMAKVANARINTLARRHVELPFAAAGESRAATSSPLRSVAERAVPLQYRPDLQEVALSRVQADEANLIVLKERYPDVELMAAYDAFWQPSERDLRPMLGSAHEPAGRPAGGRG